MSFQHRDVLSSTKNEVDGVKSPEKEVKTSWLAFLKVSNSFLSQISLLQIRYIWVA